MSRGRTARARVAHEPRRRTSGVAPPHRPVDDAPAWAVTMPVVGRDRVRVALFLVAVWAVLFAPQLFSREVFTAGDARVFRPFSEFSRDRWLATHQRTFWNPYVYAGIPGAPSLADSRPQYLPDAVLDLYERVRPSRVIPLAAPLLAHLAGMLAMAALVRRVWGASRAGMAFAGAVWGLMPELVAPFSDGHDAQFVSASLIPVLLLAIHQLFAVRTAYLALAATSFAALGALFVLTGHPQLVVYGAGFGAVFALERAWNSQRLSRLAWLCAAALLAVGLSAPVWLPALLYSGASFRGGDGAPGITPAEVSRFSYAWRDLLTLIWPWAVGFGESTYWGGLAGTDHPSYVGSAVFLLAISASVRRGAAVTRLMLIGFIVFGVLGSLGTTLGPAGLALRDLGPFGERFRSQMLWMVVAQAAMVLLAARAFAPPPDPPGIPRAAWLLGPLRVAIGLALIGPLAGDYAHAMLEARPGDSPALALHVARAAGLDLIVRSVITTSVVLLLWTARSRSPRAPLAQLGLIAAAMIGLGSVSLPILLRDRGPITRIEAAPEPMLASLGAREPAMRVFSTRRVPSVPGAPIRSARDVEFYSNDWIRWRAHALGGNHGALPAIWRPMGQETRSFGALRALGIGYVSADSGAHWSADHFEEVHRDPQEVVYRVRGALGRAYAASAVRQLPEDRDVLAAMMAQDFDPARVAFTTDERLAGEYPGSADCRIAWAADDPDRVALDVEAHDRAFVVLADTWFAGWSARLDGAPVPIARVNQLARGVVVPAGRHRLEMTYEPSGWRAGLESGAIAFVLLIVAALAATFVALRGRRAQSAAPSAP